MRVEGSVGEQPAGGLSTLDSQASEPAPASYAELSKREVTKRLTDQKMGLELTALAKALLVEEGFDPAYGARPLRRAIQRYVEDPLSEELIRGHLHGGDIEVYLDAGVLAYRPAGELVGRKLS